MKAEMMTRIVASALIVMIFAACSPGSDAAPSATTTTVTETTTTVPVTTTTAPVTTTAAPVVTTTTAPVVTTTAAPVVTTTVVIDDTLELSPYGIQAGESWLYFGIDDEVAISTVDSVLGGHSEDTGWVDSFSSYLGACPPPLVRGVKWGSHLTLIFTQAETDFQDAGEPHFYAYYSSSPVLWTTRGLMVGDTIADLESLYPGPLYEIVANPWDPVGGIWSYGHSYAGWTGLYGYSDSMGPEGVITSINGGRGCGE